MGAETKVSATLPTWAILNANPVTHMAGFLHVPTLLAGQTPTHRLRSSLGENHPPKPLEA